MVPNVVIQWFLAAYKILDYCEDPFNRKNWNIECQDSSHGQDYDNIFCQNLREQKISLTITIC